MANPDVIDWDELADEDDRETITYLREIYPLDPWEVEGLLSVEALVALAGNPRADADQRARVPLILTSIAVGDHTTICVGYPIARHRSAAAELRTGKWLPDPERDPVLQALHRMRLIEGVESYDEVLGHVADLLFLLSDANAEVRGNAAFLLSWFPEMAGELAPPLCDAMAAEPDLVARVTMGVALAMLTVPADDASTPFHDELDGRFGAWLGSDEPLERWAGAMGLSVMHGSTAPEAAHDILLAWAARRRDAPRSKEVPFAGGDLAALAAQALPLRGPVAQRALETLATSLPALTAEQGINVIEILLKLTFPDGAIEPGTPYEALTPRQRHVMRACAAAEELWRIGNFAMALEAYNLPAYPVMVVGEPNPFHVWVELCYITQPITEEGLAAGNIVVHCFGEQRDQSYRAYRRAYDRFDGHWGQRLDEERFVRFLNELFDVVMDEYGAMFPGCVKLIERGSRLLCLDITGAALR